MKKTIRTLLSLSLLLLACCLTGCGDSKPVRLVKSELNQIRKLNEQTIRSFISYADLVHSISDQDPETDAAKAIQLFFQNFNYRVLSSSIAENEATVNVEIENIDAKALAKDLCLELIARSSSPTADSSPSEISYFSLLGNLLASGDYETTKTPAHFRLQKNGKDWEILSDEALEDQLVGGFISYLKDPELVTPDEIIKKVFESLREQTPEEWVSYLGMSDIFSTYSSLYEKVDLALATQISKCFSYRILFMADEGEKATAAIKVTSLDMDNVLDVYLERLLDYASTTEAVRATDTELADKTASLLAECLNSNTKTCARSISIEFTNNGTTWEMCLNEDFTDALLGNMTEAVEKFQEEALPGN